MNFVKMHVSGNDFVITENKLDAYTVRKISDRKKGIGFDQLMVISKDNEIKIYNADGSTAETCINGTLCVAQMLMRKSSVDRITIKSCNQHFECSLLNENIVRVKLTNPSFDWEKIKLRKECDTLSLKFPGIPYETVGMSIGNPHVIAFVNSESELNELESIAEKISNSDLLMNRVNISVCNVNGSNIKARVHERGVGETLSCGSAAVCIYFAAKIKGFIKGDDEVSIKFPGGIASLASDNSNVFLSAQVNTVFWGSYPISE